MIKLHKGPEPAVLNANAEDWENVLHAHDAAGTKPSKYELNRYNHDDVKSALLLETAEKCAYCESKFRHISFGDIEHIVPKKLGHQWRYKWENLTIACTVCNNGKSSKENLVDPYVDEPEQLFDFYGPVILPHPDSAMAIATEIALELNRKDLLDKRAERLKAIHKLLTIARSQTDDTYKAILFDEIRVKEVRSEAEFAGMVRSYVRELITKGHMPPITPPAVPAIVSCISTNGTPP